MTVYQDFRVEVLGRYSKHSSQIQVVQKLLAMTPNGCPVASVLSRQSQHRLSKSEIEQLVIIYQSGRTITDLCLLHLRGRRSGTGPSGGRSSARLLQVRSDRARLFGVQRRVGAESCHRLRVPQGHTDGDARHVGSGFNPDSTSPRDDRPGTTNSRHAESAKRSS
jgi:hypothetical protein